MEELEFSQALEAPGHEFNYKCALPIDIDPQHFYPNEIVGEARVDLTYFVDLDAILNLSGNIRVPCKFICDRCGAMFEKNLFLEVNEKIGPKMSEDEELSYDMPKINIEKFVTSFVILNFPRKILCRDDCKGLCSRCGANLNDGECECVKQDRQ